MTGTRLNPVFAGLGTTIFTVMSALATTHKAINLGQGFPEEDGPVEIRAAAAKALLDGPNQYPPMMGLPVLRQALARHAMRHYDLSLDWEREIIVTSGATEALADCLIAMLQPGDEAILFEPAYDSYRPIVESVGACAIAVRLSPPDWQLPIEALERAFSPRTKLVLINSPMNPVGRVFSVEELDALAALARKHDAFVICDEVYEHLTFDGLVHVPLMTRPGMRERTVRIGSAGKIFSLTGWKVGWIEGPAELVSVIAKAHQFITFTTPNALQSGVAYGLDHEQRFYEELTRDLQAKRDALVGTLSRLGMKMLPCGGTYFVTGDYAPLGINEDDVTFAKRLTVEGGVATIPLSVFYSGEAPRTLLRFAFCKSDATIREAGLRLTQALARK